MIHQPHCTRTHCTRFAQELMREVVTFSSRNTEKLNLSTDYFNFLNFILLLLLFFFRAKALLCDYFAICLLHYISFVLSFFFLWKNEQPDLQRQLNLTSFQYDDQNILVFSLNTAQPTDNHKTSKLMCKPLKLSSDCGALLSHLSSCLKTKGL